MPSVTRLLGRRAGPIGVALTAYDIWRRLPEKQRKRLLEETRKRGPKLAAAAVKRGTAQVRNRPR
ncbi:MAG TPA: hypothetical protein VFJ77_00840 [Gaiellaceae bacterium]|nr:hypothetical protein [Gaiellaceae bacterium]